MPETPAKKPLRELRAAEKKRRGGKFTQADLAQESGVKQSNIEKYEAGHSTPDRENAVKLAAFYGVSVAYLLGSEDSGEAVRGPGYVAESGPSYGETLELFSSIEQLARFVEGIAAAGEESLAKLDAIEGYRRMITAGGRPLPREWHDLKARIERGEV